MAPATSSDTWPLTAAIRRGDEAAFASFFDAWFDRVQAIVRASLRCDHEFCLDVAQDTMLRVADKIPKLKSEGAVTAWLTTTALRKAADRLRAERRRSHREQQVAQPEIDEAAGPVEALIDHESARWLRARLDELPLSDRALLEARFFEDRTLRETGAALGMTTHAADGRLRRIVRRLRGAAEAPEPTQESS